MSVSFYRRPLSKLVTAFSAPEGRAIFKSAMKNSFMEGYFGLANNFLTQSEPAYCALACLTMVLNTLEVDPQRKWKGVWRWYSEEMLDCCKPLDKIKQNGVNFHEFACIARCNGLDVKKLQSNKINKEHFLQSIKDTCSTTDKVLVVAYSRQSLQQTGDGHYSPIGGYDPDTNSALVMDVARFKYPSYWVHVDLLWDSLSPFDAVTKERRGYYILERSKSMLSLSLLRLELDWKGWSTFANNGLNRVLLGTNFPKFATLEQVIPKVVVEFYGSMEKLNVRKTPEATEGSDFERTFSEEVHKLLHQASHHPFYHIIANTLRGMANSHNILQSEERLQKKIKLHISENSPGCVGEEVNVRAAMLTIFFLAIPKRFFSSLSPEIQQQVEMFKVPESLPQPLRDEVARTEQQMETLSDMSRNHCSDCDCFDDIKPATKLGNVS